MKIYRFPVLIEQDEDGIYVATVPSLKGCHSQARSLDELEKRIREAIELCLEVEGKEIEQNTFIGVHELEIVK
jgi:predicted RNase H-like HicB family nuclease